MVTGWFGDEIEVDRLLPTGDRSDFEVKFATGGDKRSFFIGISNSNATVWSANSESFDLDAAARRLADTLLANGADEMPHDRYLFGTTAPSTLEGTVGTINGSIGGIGSFAMPTEAGPA